MQKVFSFDLFAHFYSISGGQSGLRKPFQVPMFLTLELLNQVKQREIHGNNQAANYHPDKNKDDRLQG